MRDGCGEFDAAALYDDVDVLGRDAEKEVSHETTNDESGLSAYCHDISDCAEDLVGQSLAVVGFLHLRLHVLYLLVSLYPLRDEIFVAVRRIARHKFGDETGKEQLRAEDHEDERKIEIGA